MAAWTIYRDWTDRPKVKLVVYLADVASPGGHRDPNPRLVFQVTNVGRQPVTITHAGARMKDKRRAFVMSLPGLPKKLEPHEGIPLHTSDLERLSEARTLTVIDSTGKQWPATRRSQRRLEEDLRCLVELDSESPPQ